MKIRIVTILLLLIFGLAGVSISQDVDEARDNYIEADKERQDAYEVYNESHKAEILLDSLLGDINLENSENYEDLIKDAIDILDAVGIDLADVVTDLAAAIIKGLKDGWDWC